MITYKLLVTIIIPSSLVSNHALNSEFILKSYLFIPALNSNGQYLPFYNVGWTLNFEMFFYLLFTLALFFRISTIKFLALIFVPLSVLSFFKTPHWSAIGYYCDPVVLNFLFGMVAAKLVLKNIRLPQRIAIPVVLISLLYLFLPKTGAVDFYFGNNTIALFIAAFLVIYGGASIETKISTKIPAWLVFLGAASYSLYLIHPIVAPFGPILIKILKLKWVWVSVFLGIIISITVGVTFYKFCEKPLAEFFSRSVRQSKLIGSLKKNILLSYSWFNVSKK